MTGGTKIALAAILVAGFGLLTSFGAATAKADRDTTRPAAPAIQADE